MIIVFLSLLSFAVSLFRVLFALADKRKLTITEHWENEQQKKKFNTYRKREEREFDLLISDVPSRHHHRRLFQLFSFSLSLSLSLYFTTDNI